MAGSTGRIKECREACGMSVEDVSRLVGKNRATVYRYDNGDIENIPMKAITIMAMAFNVDPNYLMGWTDEKGTFSKEKPIILLDKEQESLIRRYDALDENRRKRLLDFMRILESEPSR